MKQLLLLAASVGIGCTSTTVYRDTWQPATERDVYPRLLNSALVLEPAEVSVIEQAGGVFIGYHATRKTYGVRAASVGGTHFVAVAGTETSHTSCTSGSVLGAPTSWCSTTAGYRPYKIAVFRVGIRGWRTLPPHLVPPTSDIWQAVPVFVTRDGCSVDGTWGRVKCGNDWQIHVWGHPTEPDRAADAGLANQVGEPQSDASVSDGPQEYENEAGQADPK